MKKTVCIDGLEIELKIRKNFDRNEKRDYYCVSSNYKNIFAVSDNVDKAMAECIDRIKRKKFVLDNNIKLISAEEGENIAKSFFEEHFKEIFNESKQDFFNKHRQDLWYSCLVDVNLLELDILCSSPNYEFDKEKIEYPEIITKIIVDLISGECVVYDK